MWSYGLTFMGALILYLAGKKRRSAWALGVGNQLVWGAYSLTTHQYGFVFGCLLYGAVYVKNWLTWKEQ